MRRDELRTWAGMLFDTPGAIPLRLLLLSKLQHPGVQAVRDQLFSIKEPWPTYLLTEGAKALANHVEVGPTFRWSLLSKLSNMRATYLTKKGEFYRFIVQDELLIALYLDAPSGWSTATYRLLVVDLVDGKIGGQYEDTRKLAATLVQYLLFVELTEPEVTVLPPKEKGTDREYENNTPLPVTVVRSDWNRISVRLDDINVKGHLRLARVGPGRTKFKLVLVQPHVRHGFTRRRKPTS